MNWQGLKQKWETASGEEERRAWWDMYSAYINSPEWRRLRLRVLERDGKKCRLCSSEFDLEAHHSNYDNLGEEEPNDLITLCRPCHEQVTSFLRERRYSKRAYKPTESKRITTIYAEEPSELPEIAIKNSGRITPNHAQRSIVRPAERME